jgi:PAC2 family
MEHLRLRSEPHLHSPVLIYAFTGWNDAGDAASGALEHMIANWAATEVGDIDPEWFTDFATVRPSVRLERDASGRGTPRRHIEWPVVRLWSASLPGADALLLLGPEPALRWRMFAEQVVELAERCSVSMAISLGALLADFPHSQPTQIIGTASDDELLDRFELRPSTYEGPTGIVGVLGDALTAAGVPTASLWATVPGYAAQIPSPKACEALVRASCAMVGTTAPAGAFTRAVAEYEARVTALVAEDQDLADYVARLEAFVADDDDDDDDDDDITAEAPRPSLRDDVDPDELYAEVERFLRDSGPGDPPHAE